MKKKAKKPTPRKKKRTPTKSGKVTLNFKVSPRQAERIKGTANRLTRGNVTALVLAGLSYVPQHDKAIAKKDYRATTRA